ncbi:MAG TPA: hypothetical protein VFQ17_15685 [Nocardioides sp.]|nr:hypothetical protein [Nocardioides sp.]
MTDFEDRLTSALHSAGDAAPDATGLAPAARRRAGVRRRRTALTSAAAVVAVGIVVGGVALQGDGDEGPSQVATDPQSSSAAVPTDEGRVETWHDVSVTVPSGWGHGSLSTWCIEGSEPGTPVVERPEGVVEDIACTPATGYGVRFFEAAGQHLEAFSPGTVNKSVGQEFPRKSWQGWDQAGSNGVLVVAPTQDEAERVLASFERVTGVDANGCTPHPADSTPAVAPGDLRLCRYGVDDWLEQSELLSGRDAAAAVAALGAAPAKGDRMCTMALTGPRIHVTTVDAQGWVTLDACHGFAWVDGEHDLTADVLYWVLTPGWTGGVDGDVPLPEMLRQ